MATETVVPLRQSRPLLARTTAVGGRRIGRGRRGHLQHVALSERALAVAGFDIEPVGHHEDVRRIAGQKLRRRLRRRGCLALGPLLVQLAAHLVGDRLLDLGRQGRLRAGVAGIRVIGLRRRGGVHAILVGLLQSDGHHIVREPEGCAGISGIGCEIPAIIREPGIAPPTPAKYYRGCPRGVRPSIVSRRIVARAHIQVQRDAVVKVGPVDVRVGNSAHNVGALHVGDVVHHVRPLDVSMVPALRNDYRMVRPHELGAAHTGRRVRNRHAPRAYYLRLSVGAIAYLAAVRAMIDGPVPRGRRDVSPGYGRGSAAGIRIATRAELPARSAAGRAGRIAAIGPRADRRRIRIATRAELPARSAAGRAGRIAAIGPRADRRRIRIATRAELPARGAAGRAGRIAAISRRADGRPRIRDGLVRSAVGGVDSRLVRRRLRTRDRRMRRAIVAHLRSCVGGVNRGLVRRVDGRLRRPWRNVMGRRGRTVFVGRRRRRPLPVLLIVLGPQAGARGQYENGQRRPNPAHGNR